jgi:hypothetical protein
VPAARAAQIAVATTYAKTKLSGLIAGTPILWMYDPALIHAPGLNGQRPVWRVAVGGGSPGQSAQAEVLVDARNGEVSLWLDKTQSARDRRVCDAQALRVSIVSACATNSPTLVATETDPPADASTEAALAYEYAGVTYDFYHSLFGRDSLDNQGMTIASTVRLCPSPAPSGPNCYSNAYWDSASRQLYFGPGFAAAPDVVAHELTHGVTEFSANLFYAYQSGAINESMSDVFGEFSTLLGPSDVVPAAGQRWLIGERLPGGPLRSMSNPAAFGQPASMTSVDFYGGEADNGGVHYNSGVGNKAAQLIATAIGVPAAAQLYYRTLLSLSSGADYADLANTLRTSCAALVGQSLPSLPSGTVTMTSGNCSAVESAITATAMTSEPAVAGGGAAEAPQCPAGSTVGTTGFSDDLEHADLTRWGLGSAATSAAFASYLDPATDPDHQSWASSGQVALHLASAASGSPTTARARLAAGITISSNPNTKTFLWFAQVQGFQSNRDGGKVSVDYVDNTSTTRVVDLGSPDPQNRTSPPVNGYDVANLTGIPGAAFNDNSHGYGSSRFDLSRFAGETVHPRFDVVGNASVRSDWLIDDITVYTCTGPVPGAVTSASVTSVPAGSTATATLTWSAPDWAGDTGIDHYEISSPSVNGGTPAAVPANGPLRFDAAGLSTSVTHTFGIRAVSSGGAGTPVAVTLVPSASSLRVTPATVVFGTQVTLSGTVTRPDTGTPHGYVLLTAYGRVRGSTTWTTIGSTSTWSNGTWAIQHAPIANTDYRVDVLGGPGRLAASSSLALATVAPRLTATWTPATVRPNQVATIKLVTSPARSYAAVELQLWTGSGWRVTQRGKTWSNGTASFSYRTAVRATYTYRVFVPGDTRFAAAASASRPLVVR